MISSAPSLLVDEIVRILIEFISRSWSHCIAHRYLRGVLEVRILNGRISDIFQYNFWMNDNIDPQTLPEHPDSRINLRWRARSPSRKYAKHCFSPVESHLKPNHFHSSLVTNRHPFTLLCSKPPTVFKPNTIQYGYRAQQRPSEPP